MILRTLGIFFLIIPFINPTLVFESFEIKKPELSLLVDNSKSIHFLEQKETIKNTLSSLLNDSELNEKFDIISYQFDNELKVLDSLSFSESQTNISNALLEQSKVNSSNNQVSILLSDGNQTIGFDYRNYQSKTQIYPIVFGDTIVYNDVMISQVNVNKYTYVGNEFPVEVFVASDSKFNIAVNVFLKLKGKIVNRKRINLNSNSSNKIEFIVKSKLKGNSFFTVEVSSLQNEKNLLNNKRRFSIEAIDEKSKIVIISSISHPDIGALKRSIESNKKRKVEIKKPDEVTNLEEYQGIVFYQPNRNFEAVFKSIQQQNKSLFIISGTQTDYNFLNAQNLGFRKNAISDIENANAFFKNDFLPFQQENVGFEAFSPLKDVFGEITFNKPYNNLLTQIINGIQTNQPLLTTLNSTNSKIVVLFGEGIWQWRASSFIKEDSFKEFNNFINNIVQFTTNGTLKNRLEIEVNPIHYSNQPVIFKSYFFDENYQFDENARLSLELTNEISNEKNEYPFSNQDKSYDVLINSLEPGVYNYSIIEARTNIARKGKIEVLETEIESQFLNANPKALKLLADNSNGQLYYPNEVSKLKKSLINNKVFRSIQLPVKEEKNLLDWWWYLIITVFFFSLEWLLRKYYGKI